MHRDKRTFRAFSKPGRLLAGFVMLLCLGMLMSVHVQASESPRSQLSGKKDAASQCGCKSGCLTAKTCCCGGTKSSKASTGIPGPSGTPQKLVCSVNNSPCNSPDTPKATVAYSLTHLAILACTSYISFICAGTNIVTHPAPGAVSSRVDCLERPPRQFCPGFLDVL